MLSRFLQQGIWKIRAQYALPNQISTFRANSSFSTIRSLNLQLPAARRSFYQTAYARPFLTSSEKASTRTRISRSFGLGGTIACGLGLALLGRSEAQCDQSTSGPRQSASPPPIPTTAPPPNPPKSSVNIYELSFGTVCGICAGVFVKKGVKTVAFLFGGLFVILQYFGSISMLRVNWTRFQSTFENMFYHTDADGAKRAPTVYSLFNWIVDFLTADFPPRATFLAGFILGLRFG